MEKKKNELLALWEKVTKLSRPANDSGTRSNEKFTTQSAVETPMVADSSVEITFTV